MILYGLVQECMVLMMIVNRVLYGMSFQGTKLSSLNSFILRSLWGSPFLDWVVLDAINTAGGGASSLG